MSSLRCNLLRRAFGVSDRIVADVKVPYVGFERADDSDAALRLRIPTKDGFTNPKCIATIYVTDKISCDDRPDRGYNWFSGS
jgi:hypothetical protein